MNYFKNYVSNTLAGTSNQLFFDNSASMGKECFGMMFYKLTVGQSVSQVWLGVQSTRS